MKCTKFKNKTEKGITLIALIITIVVLMILAAVAISSITNDGILGHAGNSATKYNEAVGNEQTTLEGYLNYLDKNSGGSGAGGELAVVTLEEAISDAMLSRTTNSQTEDIHGNIIKIPAGFKIVVDSNVATYSVESIPSVGYTIGDISVTKGVVITDGTNEFVWVPTGTIKTSKTEKTDLTLARYVFEILTYDETGTATGFGTGAISETHTSATDQIVEPVINSLFGVDAYFVEGKIEGIAVDDEGNDTKGYAKDIDDFISKASSGYYIGRYEARENDTKLTCNATDSVWNDDNARWENISKLATKVCQNMYTNKPFTTDLVNSFAWDTAIAFIQKFEDEDYSIKTFLDTMSTVPFLEKGTVSLENPDKACNIYDMSTNYGEITTESNNGGTDTARGGMDVLGLYLQGEFSQAGRRGSAQDGAYSFRPILYL